MVRLSRRAMLKGALGGSVVTLALPPLEAMWGPRGARADDPSQAPIFGVFFWANGTPWHAGHGATQGEAGHPDLWTPSTVGSGFTPSTLLAPLAGHPFSIATGLTPHTEVPPNPPGQEDGHMRGFMVALTSDRPRSEGFDHPSHTLTARRPSIDQIVARSEAFHPDGAPLFRSLTLGVDTARFHDYGHWNAISYNGPNSLNLPVLDPGQLWNYLFDVPDDLEVLDRRAAVLDAVLEDAKSLRTRLGATDKQRLDAHLEHIESIGRRLRQKGGSCEAPGMPGTGTDLLTKTEIMGELLAVALQCGLTRVFSFMVTSPASTHVFANVGATDGMHKTCHDGHWDRVRDITAFHMQCFARFLDVLAGHVDPMGNSLLDRCCILGTSEYGEGWQHSVAEMPAILAGRASGGLVPGVHVREPGGNFSKVHVTALRAVGIETQSYGFSGGETSEHLSGILA